jgi:hypothetical protein
MNECEGAVVIALERFRFPDGEERPGTAHQQTLTDVSLPTPWNQIEAAMAYSRGLPLLVVVDHKLRSDGLLEVGNDWYVQALEVTPASLNTPAFMGILESWRGRIGRERIADTPPLTPNPASMTVAQLLGILKPPQLWACIVALVAALGAAFALGAQPW